MKYFKDPYNIIIVLNHFHYSYYSFFSISYEIIPIIFPLLPNPLKFLQPKEDSHASAFVQFVLWLEPPVYLTDVVAASLANFAGTIFQGFYSKYNLV